MWGPTAALKADKSCQHPQSRNLLPCEHLHQTQLPDPCVFAGISSTAVPKRSCSSNWTQGKRRNITWIESVIPQDHLPRTSMEASVLPLTYVLANITLFYLSSPPSFNSSPGSSTVDANMRKKKEMFSNWKITWNPANTKLPCNWIHYICW